MSKLLLHLALGSTKALVNSYTVCTLPMYFAIQKPWIRKKRSQSFGLRSTVDKYQRTVYSRPCATRNFDHPALHCKSFNEMVPTLVANRRVIASRKVLSESSQLDAVTGLPIKVDGRELKQIQLSDQLRWLTVGDVMERVDALARCFQHSLGMKKSEKVALYADNSFEWFCCALALQRINAVSITLLSILNTDSLIYSLNQSEAYYLITSQELMQKKVNVIADQLTSVRSVIYIESKLPTSNTKTEINNLQKIVLNLKKHHQFSVMKLQEIEAKGRAMPLCEFAIPHPQDVALVMYTSGTTGNQAKGVVMTHENIATGLHNLLYYDAELDYPLLKSRFASFLPMSHIFGYMLNFSIFIDKGEIVFCSPHTLFDSSPAHVPGQIGDLKLIQPEYISLVPLVLDRILKEINRKLETKSKLAMPLFEYLMDYKIKWQSRGYQTPIINQLICKKLNEQFGGNLKTITVGSAPLNSRTQALVQAALNIRCTQGYGSTEMTAGATIMHNDDLTYGSSGIPFNSARFYLKDWPEAGYFSTDCPNPRGEVVVGGANITSGYYKMEKETAESFKKDADGQRWFESGDIGELLPNGTLKIIDRKKDLTKLSNGEFVSLGKIESALRSSVFVENIAICTWPAANYVVALIQPNRQAITTLTTEKLGLKSLDTLEKQFKDDQVKKAVLNDLINVGKGRGLSVKELPKRVHLATEEWTQDNHLVTAALKLRRKQVIEFYAKEIKQLFC